MKIVPLDRQTAAWDAFVTGHPDATFFHQSAWRDVLTRAFGHRAHYLTAEQDGAIAGVLPLIEVKTRLFGHSLMSLPFCVYGGPLTASTEAAAALAQAAMDLRAKTGARAAELRFREPPAPASLPGLADGAWVKRDGLYATFRKPISADHETNFKAISRKQRAMVRKGIDRGLTATADTSIDRAHAIYAESVRNLGTPVFSRKYFRLLAETFPHHLDVVTVFDAGAPIAAVINFYWRDEVLPYYGGGTAAARGAYANDFMYWDVMRRAVDRGARMFDFGRSKEGTGAYAFKKNWGFAPSPLPYYFALGPGQAIPELNPLNPKYRLMIDAWKRLPLPIANLLGPHLVRGVG